MKKNKRKALLLAGLASMAILCGCSNNDNNKTVEIEGVIYVQNGDEYVKVDTTPKVFEPGEHKIAYVNSAGMGYSYSFEQGWEDLYSYVEFPEGYELLCVTAASSYSRYTDTVIYTFVNTEKVEVQGTYNPKTGVVEYNTPGTVVEEKKLEIGG